MNNVSVFDMNGGRAALCPTGEIAPAAAAQAVVCRKDARLCLRVNNAGEAGIVVRLKAGNGPRAVLGDKDVTVGAAQTAYIPLFDTARFKRMDSGAVIVTLADADGDALSTQGLEDVSLEAVQM